MKKTLLVFLLLLVTSSILYASNLLPKALGMGGAHTARTDDISSLLYNPAGLGDISYFDLHIAVGCNSSDIYNLELFLNEYNDSFIDYFDDINKFEGQVFAGASLGSLALALNINNNIIVDPFKDSVINLFESSILLGFGDKIDFSQHKYGPLNYFSYGVTGKYIRQDILNYDNGNNFTGNTQNLGIDLGLKAGIFNLIDLGFMLENVFIHTLDVGGDIENILSPARIAKAGVAVNVPLLDITVAGDIDIPFLSDEDIIFRVGAEKDLFFNGITIRGGCYFTPGKDKYYTAGLGLNLLKLHLDAGIVTSDFNENMGFSLSGNILF